VSARRRLAAALAAGALVLSGCGFHGLYSTPLPGGASLGDHPYSVTAYFSDVLDLVPQSAVKVDDVPVGRVTSIALGECPDPGSAGTKIWCAKVEVKVNGSVDLPANARAEILQTSLLGEKYVSLEKPASAVSAKLRNGSQIPLSLTESAPEAEDVLGALSLVLNEGGLSQIQVIAQELNKAFDAKDRQVAVRDLLKQLTSFTGTLDAQKDTITTALANIDTLAVTLRKQEGVIVQSLDTFPAALKALSQERGKLVTLLSSLSHLGSVATTVVNATQTDLTGALKSLSPTLEALTAAGSSLPGALRIAGTFPFPLGNSRQFVKGDYANLDLDLNLNLSDTLCGLSVNLCDIAKKLPLSTQKSEVKLKTDQPATLTPQLLGSKG
jgi:phospholipid/cholesterol/gamma-HCH transport system substrate-binding protein